MLFIDQFILMGKFLIHSFNFRQRFYDSSILAHHHKIRISKLYANT